MSFCFQGGFGEEQTTRDFWVRPCPEEKPEPQQAAGVLRVPSSLLPRAWTSLTAAPAFSALSGLGAVPGEQRRVLLRGRRPPSVPPVPSAGTCPPRTKAAAEGHSLGGEGRSPPAAAPAPADADLLALPRKLMERP